jgi:hypothetical protein
VHRADIFREYEIRGFHSLRRSVPMGRIPVGELGVKFLGGRGLRDSGVSNEQCPQINVVP